MNRILIKNGHIVDPANNIDGIKDIFIEGKKIVKVADNIKSEADLVIDAKDKIVIPGLVDMHVHLREPGREDKETVSSGTRAAAHGGVTSVLAMPNTNPAIDSKEALGILEGIIKKDACVNVYICASITKARAGRELVDFGLLKEKGAVAFSDDGSSVEDKEIMLEALRNVAKAKGLIIAHCEDKTLSGSGVVNLGLFSTKLGLRGISNESEYKRIERDIALAHQAGSSIHIAHVSTRQSVEAIAEAKSKKIKVTAEASPHHLALSEEAVCSYDTNMKMNPPLRSKDDVSAIKKALKSGVIDVIASDHAPHTENEKEIEFDRSEFGVIGLETMLSVCIDELINAGILGWGELVRKLSLNPANILGVDKGTLSVGADADIVVVDPKKEWVVAKDNLFSKSKNCAFLGKKLKGVVDYTLCAGKIVYKG